MKTTYFLPVAVILFFTFGCGLLNRFKEGANAVTATPTPAPTVVATPAATATPDVSPTPFDKASLGKNLMAFGAGTIIVGETSVTNGSDGLTRGLIDESGQGWATADGQTANQSVTLELPARTTFKTFVFDAHQPTYYDGRSAKDVMIEVSDESPTGGFQTVLEATLKDSDNKNGVDDQIFPVSKEIPARFVRYTAKNNFGSPEKIFTKEVFGYGTQEPPAAVANISGTYDFTGFSGKIHLKQEGNSIIGCYSDNDGLLEGTIDGRTLTLTASEKDARAKSENTSFVAANVVAAGKTIQSAWWRWAAMPEEKNYDHFYVGTKVSDKIGNCPHLPDLDGAAKDVVKENLEKELEENGKAILYGINFDFNSDVIRPESKPTLDKVIAILKDKPDWKFSVEGHTDNIGGEAFNQTLSEKRAASVVKYLTAAGIEQNRLSSKGYGLSKPLAPNNSEAERAQNRRVELLKQ